MRSGVDHLLRRENPGVIIGSYDARNYALCFSCHDEALVSAGDSTAVTSFNEGYRNLHHLHITNGGRSRGCSTCHAVHGATGPRLIAERAAYEGSQWMMPLGFELTETGGRCSPGCHEPMSYDRTGGVR